jgi:hypothetical protein
MPKGPKGEKRPINLIGNPVDVMKIATGENLASAKAAPAGSGDTWTWTGIDAESKLILARCTEQSMGHTQANCDNANRTRLN